MFKVPESIMSSLKHKLNFNKEPKLHKRSMNRYASLDQLNIKNLKHRKTKDRKNLSDISSSSLQNEADSQQEFDNKYETYWKLVPKKNLPNGNSSRNPVYSIKKFSSMHKPLCKCFQILMTFK